MKKIFVSLITLMMLSSCGFKVLNKSELSDFNIKELRTSGDKRINYKIRNDLLTYNKEKSTNILTIELDSKKEKIIKEKNIKNQITKYQIIVKVNMSLNIINRGIKEKINLSTEGSYTVAENNSSTRNNEKKLIENLVSNISQKILDKIISRVNDY
tara:strand:+ start:101 stop:568 length:468 start_codon:yes stop_codon:yes gene_type:complete